MSTIGECRFNEKRLYSLVLVLGWVTIRGRVNHLYVLPPQLTSHTGQLSLAIPPWVGTMSTEDFILLDISARNCQFMFIYTVSQKKTSHFNFCHNFANC